MSENRTASPELRRFDRIAPNFQKVVDQLNEQSERNLNIGGVSMFGKTGFTSADAASAHEQNRTNIKRAIAELKLQRDPLTKLANRGKFFNEGRKLAKSVTQQSETLALTGVMVDLDDFGVVNRTEGQLAGDEILRQVRKSDVTTRLGGEEFATLIPYTKISAPAESFGERIRRQINRITLPEKDQQMTASVGQSDYIPGESFDSFFHRINRASTFAKMLGKNRTVIARREGKNEIYMDLSTGEEFTATIPDTQKALDSGNWQLTIEQKLYNATTGKLHVVAANDSGKPILQIAA